MLCSMPSQLDGILTLCTVQCSASEIAMLGPCARGDRTSWRLVLSSSCKFRHPDKLFGPTQQRPALGTDTKPTLSCKLACSCRKQMRACGLLVDHKECGEDSALPWLDAENEECLVSVMVRTVMLVGRAAWRTCRVKKTV